MNHHMRKKIQKGSVPNVEPQTMKNVIQNVQLGRRIVMNEPHASDCAYWVDEPCDCMMRFDADELLDLYKDREMGI